MLAKKIAAGISALRRVKPFADKETLISIYNVIIRPHFDYCCEVWDVLGITKTEKSSCLSYCCGASESEANKRASVPAA